MLLPAAAVSPLPPAPDSTRWTKPSTKKVTPTLERHSYNGSPVVSAGQEVAKTSPNDTTAPTTASRELLYLIQPVYKLPSIDTTRTVASMMVSRRNARSVDAWVVRIAVEHSVKWHILSFVFICVSPFIVVTETAITKLIITVAITLTLVPVLLVHGATLCWDMLRLLACTFEFWFLFIINVVDNMVWVSLFRGVRVLAMLEICAACMIPIFLDANLHTRALVLRLLLTGAPTLMFSFTVVNLRLAADLVYTTVDCWGVTIDPVDVMASGTWTVALFMAKKAFRNRHLIFSRRITLSEDTILCEMFHPTCRLVLYDEAVRRRQAIVARGPLGHNPLVSPLTKTQLELSDVDQLQVIDAGNIFLTRCLPNLHTRPNFQGLVCLLNAIGVIGCASLLGLTVWQFILPSRAFPMALIVPTCAATGFFVLVHFTHLQRTLFKSILFEIDTWFVSIQATIVCLGACDVLLWDQRSLLVGVAWVWLHWMISLDALTPVLHQRLQLSRWFILLVNGTLVLCPLWLAYMLYFSDAKTRLRNRVVFRFRIARVDVQGEMLSFLASRIFTLWAWMCRFVWRELMRPADAFKLIKHRVQFRVGTS